MPISDLGYRSWEGKRVPALWRWLAITRSHVGVAYRSSKLLRRFLVVAWLPLLYFAPVFFAVGWVADPSNDLSEGGIFAMIGRELLSEELIEQLRQHPEVLLPAVWSVAFYFFFTLSQSFLAMVVIAIVGPPLISKDVRNRAFLLYFSKPISPWEYLLGKLGVALFFVFAITLFPALLLYAISIAFSPDLGTVVATAPIIGRIFLAAITIGLPVAMVVLLLSSLTKEHRIATFAWVTLWILGEISYRVIAFNGAGGNEDLVSWAFLASLREVLITATAGVFGLTGYMGAIIDQLRSGGVDVEDMMSSFARDIGDGDALNPAIAEALGVGPSDPGPTTTVAFLFLAGITVLCALVIRRRISKPVRI